MYEKLTGIGEEKTINWQKNYVSIQKFSFTSMAQFRFSGFRRLPREIRRCLERSVTCDCKQEHKSCCHNSLDQGPSSVKSTTTVNPLLSPPGGEGLIYFKYAKGRGFIEGGVGLLNLAKLTRWWEIICAQFGEKKLYKTVCRLLFWSSCKEKWGYGTGAGLKREEGLNKFHASESGGGGGV